MARVTWPSNYPPKGRNERKRKEKEFRAKFTRRQWNAMHQAEVQRRHRERGLDRFGTPLKKAV